eukprot:2678619-Ditylum_brightwellii.AAC.1
MMEERTTTSLTINLSTVTQGGSEIRQCLSELNVQVSSATDNSAKVKHSIIVHETKKQILELAKKDAMYDGDGGN